jgi:hypothetical protein
MSRYNNRSGVSFSRDSDFHEVGGDPDWVQDFVKNLEVNSAKSRGEENSVYDQINNILGNKSKYSSVEEAVEDMKNRTGLSEYLAQIKQASSEDALPEGTVKTLFEKIPELKNYIDNYVKDRPGTVVDAVVQDILKIPSIRNALPEDQDVPDDVKKYISEKIGECRGKNMNDGKERLMGRVDLKMDENTVKDQNPFTSCNPSSNND